MIFYSKLIIKNYAFKSKDGFGFKSRGEPMKFSQQFSSCSGTRE